MDANPRQARIPRDYSGDALSAERLGGSRQRDCAIVQSLDFAAVIAAGIATFRSHGVSRISSCASGAARSECGCRNALPDDDTLASVAAAGIKFVILGPGRASSAVLAPSRVRPRPFRWRSGELSLAVFRP